MTKVYLDAALQNAKSVFFFTFLQVLIARLGASNFQIALSNSLPPLFAALSLAFLTRQLPVTKGVFLTSGYVRQLAFLCIAFSALLPHPVPFILFFWSINAAAVMVTSAQQPAIMRRWIEDKQFPAIFSRNKLIGIIIVTIGSYMIGHYLDATDNWFPKNYVLSMLIGAVSTFAGMSLIASLAPKEKQKIHFTWVRPFQECDRTTWWMALNNIGISMANPLFIIYHVKILHLDNKQIALFVVVSGIVSAMMLPIVRRLMEKFGSMQVYAASVVIMAASVLPYGFLHHFWLLVVFQAWIGTGLSVHEVSSQSVMMDEANRHQKEMAYFSDFQLVFNAGNAIGPLIASALLLWMPIHSAFITIAVLRILFFASRVDWIHKHYHLVRGKFHASSHAAK